MTRSKGNDENGSDSGNSSVKNNLVLMLTTICGVIDRKKNPGVLDPGVKTYTLRDYF